MLVIIIILNCLIHNIFASRIYNCLNGTVYVSLNEISFYETTDFPRFLSQSETDSCNITFVLTHYNASNKLKMLNAFMQPDEFGLTKYTFLTTNHPSFTVQIPFFSQKGVVIFEETDKNCPLESISKKIPFKMYDEREIIFIYSNYYTNKARKKACLWRFEAPEGYGLKIVIQTFNVSAQTSLRIKNTTDLLINERSVKVNFPYYNNDKYLEIYLSKGNPFFVADIEFQAYVSIVKSEEEKQKINCTIWEADNIITWTNIDENYTGYAANTQCNYNFIVRKHYVVIVNVVDLYMEEGVDFVSYNTDKNNSIIVSNKGVFVIEPYKNGTEKYVSWKFVTDGSINLWVCQCVDRIFKCNSKNVLMNSTENEDYYCGNLQCNITIDSCPSNLTSVIIDFGDFRENYDIFRVISNNQTILDIGRQKKIFFEIFLNSMNNNIIQVITFSSSKYKTLIISVDSVLEIKIETKIVLSDNETSVRINPIYPVFIPFEMKKPLISLNVSFKIHCVNPSAITLYNNESLAATLDNCFTESSPYTCIIKENSFVLYQEEATVSAITLSNGSKNCVFQKNIILPTNSQIIIVSAISSKNGKCLLTILLDSYYFISHLWTTSKTENVKVFVGIDQTKLLFEFNSNTVNKWKNILLMSPVYTILLPESKALYMKLKWYDQNSPVMVYPYQSIVTTPWYGCFKNNNDHNILFLTYKVKESPIKFTVLDYTFLEEKQVYFELGYTKVFINKTGDIVIFKNQDVTLRYLDVNQDKYGALFFIET